MIYLSLCMIEKISEIKEKHKYACNLRDGCGPQIKAGPEVTSHNVSLGRNIITAKYAAASSMTQSMNDGGHGHNSLHRLFESKNFKMRPYSDPASTQYKALKEYLTLHITPASFKTYWAFLCAFEPYIKKAINPVVVKSAAKKSGFEANTINVRTIMSYNKDFCSLSNENAESVIGLITTVLAPYFREHQWIPESLYPEIFPQEAGFGFTLSNREGTPLNDLTTNRQRFIVDNSEQWQAVLANRNAALEAAAEEKERKRLEREAADAAKPKKVRSCSHLGCKSVIDITTTATKRITEGTWKKCKGKNCAIWACPDHFTEIALHETFCPKCTSTTI